MENVWTIAFLALMLLPAYALAAEAIPTRLPSATRSIQREFADVLKTTTDDLWTLKYDVHGRGDHVRIRYTSARPVPVLLAPLDRGESRGFDSSAVLVTVLPESSVPREADLPLFASSAWHPWKKGAVVFAFGTKDAAPTVSSLAMVRRASWTAIMMALLRHSFAHEEWKPLSINTLRGYRIGNVPIQVPLVIAMLAVLLIARIFLQPQHRRAAVPWILSAGVLLYAARFALDSTASAVTELSLWRADRGYRIAVGDTYRVLPAIDAVAREQGNVVLAVCEDPAGDGYHSLVLRYFLFPMPVAADDAQWRRATHAVLFDAGDWREHRASCAGKSRAAELLARFPDGAVLLQFTPSS